MPPEVSSRSDAPPPAVGDASPDDGASFATTARKVLQQSTASPGEIPPREFELGERFPLLGDPRRVVATAQRDAPAVVGDRLVLATSHGPGGPDVREGLEELYRAAARRYAVVRIPEFAADLGVDPPDVELFDAPARLVDCRTEGPVRVNWRAVMAPREVLDHALVHGLAHRRVGYGESGAGPAGHGPAFEDVVARVRPDFDYDRWLDPTGIAMRLPP